MVGCSVEDSEGGAPAQTRGFSFDLDPEHGLLGTQPEACGECHQEHYQQWSGSMHAYAAVDPVYKAMVRKSLVDTNGRIGQFCFQCHTPLSSKLGLTEIVNEGADIQLLNELNDKRLESSVSCVACHAVSAVNATENAQLSYDSEKLYGAKVTPEALEAHPLDVSGFFADPYQNSFLCGSCHNVLNPRGARLEATFSEWYASDYNQPNDLENHQSCAHCHMPTMQGKITKDGVVTEIHAHRFVGVDQALIPFPDKEKQAELVQNLLQNAAELSVRLASGEDGDFLVVTVTNTNTGHALPSGSTADRQMWVHLEIRDDEGRLLYESGMTDEDGNLSDGVVGHSRDPHRDPELLLFGQFVFGESGEHVVFPWEVYSTADNLIGPGQLAWRDYPLTDSVAETTEIHVSATLKYRTFPPFVLQALADEGFLDLNELDALPIVEMAKVSATYRRD